nr:hypothetical protein Iba_chr14eCG4640 [Ipomoea batatas]
MGFTFILNLHYCFLPSSIYSSFSLANFSLQATGYTLRGPNVGRQSGATTSRHTLWFLIMYWRLKRRLGAINWRDC